jgi:hypothetical protein
MSTAQAEAEANKPAENEEQTMVPADKINLRVLLTNGSKHDFLFTQTDTVSNIKTHIFQFWPKGLFGIG